MNEMTESFRMHTLDGRSHPRLANSLWLHLELLQVPVLCVKKLVVIFFIYLIEQAVEVDMDRVTRLGVEKNVLTMSVPETKDVTDH